MTRNLQPALALFAIGMMELGALGMAKAGFALEWLPLAPWIPLRLALAYVACALMLVCGAGLFAGRTRMWSVRILLPWLVVWQLLRLPDIIRHPGIEGVWESFAEVAVLLAAGLVLLVRFGGGRLAEERGVRLAQLWFGLWLIPIGLSHFFYAAITYGMVPAWMPWRGVWGPVVGVAHIAAGVAVLCGARIGVLSRVAAFVWAAMIGLFTLLIWIPAAAAHPGVLQNWSELSTSWAMAAGALVVAQGWSSESD
jgi:uncharacterized membrane protein